MRGIITGFLICSGIVDYYSPLEYNVNQISILFGYLDQTTERETYDKNKRRL